MSAAITIILAVTALMILVYYWIRSLADLAWMLTIRKRIVGVSMLAWLLLIVWIVGKIPHLAGATATAFTAGYLLVPILAKPTANLVALALAYLRKDEIIAKPDRPNWSRFIFAQQAQKQKDSYVAPPIAP